MTTLRTAAQQALEALERLQNAIYNIGGEHVTGLGGANDAADSAEKPMDALKAALAEPVACFIGAKGSAFDLPTTKRAYSYAEQPGDAVAYRLGVACIAAALQSSVDSIDRGLGLLKELQTQGFGVFDIGAEYVAQPQQAEPVAWMDIDSEGNRLSVRQWSDGNSQEVPLYLAPQRKLPSE